MSSAPKVTRVRAAFYAIDSLFRLSWAICVPTFFVYSTDVLESATAAMTLVFVIYLFSFLFEASLGALADITSGPRGFYVACAFSSLGAIAFAVAPAAQQVAGLSQAGVLAWLIFAELLTDVGIAMHSGAFERWYTQTLELAGETRPSSGIFVSLRVRRAAAGLVGGTIGIALFGEFAETGGDASNVHLIPHTWAALGRVAALGVAVGLRTTLGNTSMIRGGGGRVVQLGTRPAAFRRALKDVPRVLADGLREYAARPRLRGTAAIASAYQLLHTAVNFLIPAYLVRVAGSATGERLPSLAFLGPLSSLVIFWVASQLLRIAGGFAIGRLWSLERVGIGGIGALAGAAATVGGLAMIEASPQSSEWIVPVAMLVFLLGALEPSIDAMTQDESPPDLRAVIASIRIMVASVATVIALLPSHFLAVWNGSSGGYDFPLLLGGVGASAISLSLVGWRDLRGGTDASSMRDLVWTLAAARPVRALLLFSSCGMAVVALDHVATTSVGEYRALVSPDDLGVSLLDQDDSLLARHVASAAGMVVGIMLFVAMPIVMGVRLYRVLHRRVGHSVDSEVALTLADFFHNKVEETLQATQRHLSWDNAIAAPSLDVRVNWILADVPSLSVPLRSMRQRLSEISASVGTLYAKGRLRPALLTRVEEPNGDVFQELRGVLERWLLFRKREDELLWARGNGAARCWVQIRTNVDPRTPCYVQMKRSLLWLALKESVENGVLAATAREQAVSSGLVQIRVHVTHAAVWVYVADNGPGFPDRDWGELEFYGSSFRDGGSGLGLYVLSVLRRLGLCDIALFRSSSVNDAKIRFCFSRAPASEQTSVAR